MKKLVIKRKNNNRKFLRNFLYNWAHFNVFSNVNWF